jgi:hypothetical protein
VAALRHGVRWAVDHTGPVGAAAEWAFEGLGYLLASGISWADEHTDGLASSTLQWIDGETYGGAVRRGLRENLGVGQRVAQNVGDAVRYTFDIALALLPIGPAGRARTMAQFERSSARTLTRAETVRAARLTGRHGGRFGQLERLGKEGYQRHHPIAAAISPIPYEEAPAFHMETLDHMRTASYGNGPAAQRYKAAQKRLADSGRMDEAMHMDIRDVRSKFGNKYDREISEMLDYAKERGYIPRTFEP